MKVSVHDVSNNFSSKQSEMIWNQYLVSGHVCLLDTPIHTKKKSPHDSQRHSKSPSVFIPRSVGT